MKLRKRKKRNWLWVFVIILFNSFLLVDFIGKKITQDLDELVIRTVNKNTYTYIFNSVTAEVMKNEEINNLIHLDKNKDDEIISMDYRLDTAYTQLNEIITNLYANVSQIKIDSIYYDKEKDVFFLPIGFFKDNVFFSHLGSKVPCKVELLSNIKVSFKTKVSSYGINTILIELYLDIETIHSIINPMSKEFGEHSEILLSSKIVNGKVPSYYGGVIEKSSPIVSS